MPWCPKCKSEYVEGMTECADCKVALVDELVEETEDDMGYVEIEDMPVIEVDDDGKEDIERPTMAVKYENYHDKAENFRSSAYTLVLVGVLGIGALVLLYMDVLPIHFYGASKYLTNAVMGALFLIFIVVGIRSFKSAKQYEIMAVEEDKLTADIKQWVSDHINAQDIIAEENAKNPNLLEEMQYFFYFGSLKKKVTAAFPQAPDAYLDNLLEELYAQLFEE